MEHAQEKVEALLPKIDFLEKNLNRLESLDNYMESVDSYIRKQYFFEQQTQERIEKILSTIEGLESNLKKVESLDGYIENQTVFEQQTQGKIIALSDRIELLECRLKSFGFVGKSTRLEGGETEKAEETKSVKKNDLSVQEVEQSGSERRRRKIEGETVDNIIIDKDNKKFYQALNLIENTKNSIFLTGKAGTGKTTFLKYLRNNTKKQHIILSPTGVAAVNAGGVTIHSFFQLELQPYLPKDDNLMKVKLRYEKEKIEIIRALELIIIDEISMVRSDVLEAVSYILQTYRGNNQPFGGVQMVFIGDLFQLPPVAEDDIWKNLKDYYRSEYFFDAPVLQSKSMSYFMIELDKIYRQTDNQFIDLLNKVRVNKLNECDYDALNQRYVESIDNLDAKGHIVLVSHRADANKVNRNKLNSLGNKLHKFKAIVEGDKEFKKAPADKLLELKVGAQVMLLRNNLPEYYNGSMGIVEEIGFNVVGFSPSKHDFVKIRLFSNNQVVTVSQETWHKYEYHFDENKKKIVSKVVGKFTQFPIRLAWAMTIHKSQGLTFDKVIVDAEQAFAHGQTYVALSRCRSLEGLILKSPIPPESIIVDNRVVEFLENFKQSRIN